MTHLWCILVPFGVYFTVSGSPCFQCSKNIEHFLGFIIDCILFPIQSLITRLNSQRLSVVTRAWAAYGISTLLHQASFSQFSRCAYLNFLCLSCRHNRIRSAVILKLAENWRLERKHRVYSKRDSKCKRMTQLKTN